MANEKTINERVAAALGWKVVRLGDGTLMQTNPNPSPLTSGLLGLTPDWQNDLNAAVTLLDGQYWGMEAIPVGDPIGGYSVTIYIEDEDATNILGWSKNLPEAICLAFLDWKESA